MTYNRYSYETISPYRDVFVDVARPLKWWLTRALWDARPVAWASHKRLKNLKNSHIGEKAVIVCNGPSLLQTDLELLKNIPTFGLNKINLLFDKKNFRPSYIVSVNKFVIEQNREFYKKTEIPLFLDSCGVAKVGVRDNITYLHSVGKQAFARDCAGSIFQGGTVTYVAMQIAYHLGYRHIALVGCDHNFASSGPANKTVISDEKDDSHFDPNYFAGGVKWQLPDLVQSEISYTLAREVYEAIGGSIVNATVGGKLEIFPRVTLNDFVMS